MASFRHVASPGAAPRSRQTSASEHRSIGERIAQQRSRGKAVSWFVYGSGLGSAFYSVFPTKPTMREVPMATPVVGLLLTLHGFLIGVLPDPLLKRLGLHHRQLRTLINAIEDRLYLMRQRLKPACPGA